MRAHLGILVGVAIFGIALSSNVASTWAAGQQCDAAAFGALIDETAQTLRTLNRDSERRFQDRIRSIAKTKGWSDAQVSLRSEQAMDDPRLSNFNAEIEQLVTQLDALSATPNTDISCEKLNDLRAVRDKLVTTMGQKSGFILGQLEADAAKTPSVSSPASKSTPPTNTETQRANTPPPPVASLPEDRVPEARTAPKPSSSWSANTTNAPQNNANQNEPKNARSPTPDRLAPLPLRPSSPPEDRTASLPPQNYDDPTPLPPPTPGVSDGYTVQDIRDAGRGLFGGLTAEFASVINFAFQKYGQPNGYIVGDEGGGAFLAGLRYGDGKLFLRINGVQTGPEKIYWQGPSIGADIGATGSSVIFLVYNLDSPGRLHRRFSGIDGSAYAVGGVGLTVLRNGNTVIVPIRAGLGLRIGANLGYLRFSERRSLNPF